MLLETKDRQNPILRTLLEDFEPLDLRPSQIEVKEGQVPADVVGDAYEYMIGEFARMAEKKAGSFYTPAAVSEIMARIVNVRSGDRVYDPTCVFFGFAFDKSCKEAECKSSYHLWSGSKRFFCCYGKNQYVRS